MRGLVWATMAAIGALALVLPQTVATTRVLGTAAGMAERGEPGESIPTYDVVLAIGRDGVLHVRETITYDFGDRGEHGILRRVPYRIKNRLYDIRNVRTSSSTGAPARAKATKVLHQMHISVGDTRRTVTGRQAYVIEYDVVGALTSRSRGPELRWDAIGSGWDVPIGEVSVRVEAPVRPLGVRCRAGEARDQAAGLNGDALTRCGWDRDGPYAVDFTQGGLRPHESVLIGVVLPKGSVKVPAPRYARPHFDASRLGYAGLALCLAAAFVIHGHGRRTGRISRPERVPRAGGLLVAIGSLAILADVADEMVADGVWAASIGDLTLVGLGLAVSGAVTIISGRTEREAEGDHRA